MPCGLRGSVMTNSFLHISPQRQHLLRTVLKRAVRADDMGGAPRLFDARKLALKPCARLTDGQTIAPAQALHLDALRHIGTPHLVATRVIARFVQQRNFQHHDVRCALGNLLLYIRIYQGVYDAVQLLPLVLIGKDKICQRFAVKVFA